MKKLLLLTVVVLMTLAASAQEPIEMKVWTSGAPNSNGLTGPEEPLENGRVANVTDPVIYVYKADPAKNTGAAVILCPGGGYVRLAMNHEGHDVAKWLAENGITGIVLKYRMPNGHPDVPLSDALQAIRLVRANATAWGIDPAKVGIGGNSAGGHLAATAATLYDSAESRPDFAVLFYPAISLDPAIGHAGSLRGLLGENATPALIDRYSAEKQVTADTPPTLLFHSDNDTGVSPLNSVAFYTTMKQHKVKGSLYIFPTGGHGWGYQTYMTYHEEWKTLMLKWLEDMKFTTE